MMTTLLALLASWTCRAKLVFTPPATSFKVVGVVPARPFGVGGLVGGAWVDLDDHLERLPREQAGVSLQARGFSARARWGPYRQAASQRGRRPTHPH